MLKIELNILLLTAYVHVKELNDGVKRLLEGVNNHRERLCYPLTIVSYIQEYVDSLKLMLF